MYTPANPSFTLQKWGSCGLYINLLTWWNSEKFGHPKSVVIILNFEQCDFSVHLCVQKKQTERQTVQILKEHSDVGLHCLPNLYVRIWAASWQNQQNGCAPSEDSDQPGHPRPVWSESSLCAQWVAIMDPSFLHADSEDSDRTGRMLGLIWVLAGRTCHFVGFVMRRLLW